MARIVLYAHDTYGLGHLRRCLKLAEHFAASIPEARGLILTGSPWYPLFPPPPGFAIVPLPPVTKTGPGRYAPRQPGDDFVALLADRRRRIDDAVRDFRPHLFLVDNVPCGLHGEVLPALRQQAAGSGRAVLVLRDVLDHPDTVRDEWARAGADEALDELFEEIWIFGETADADALSEDGLLGAVRSKVHVCGRLPSSLSKPATQPSKMGSGPRRVLVTGGGGGDAAPLVNTYLEAVARFRPRATSRVVLGPDASVPSHLADGVRPASETRIHRFLPELPAAMEQADVVVAMAGYNTVCEILESGRPAVLVPRRYPRQEQWLRALSWQREGRIELVDPTELSPDALWQAIETALDTPAFPRQRPAGGRRAVRRATALLDRAVAEVRP